MLFTFRLLVEVEAFENIRTQADWLAIAVDKRQEMVGEAKERLMSSIKVQGVRSSAADLVRVEV